MNKIRIIFLVTAVLLLCPGLLFAQSVNRGPYLQQGTDSSMIVRWRTSSDTDSVVRYGTDPANLNNTVTVSGNRSEHEVLLSGLTAATRYFYSVGTSAAALAGNNSYRFDTSPVTGPAAATRIWVVGDSGTANQNARNVRDAYKSLAGTDTADLMLMLGDNAYNDGTDAEYQAAVFDIYPEILRQTPVWPTLGNHDGHSADSASQTGPYYDIFSLPAAAQAGGLASGTEAYYSFNYANIHFICLDSYETSRSTGGAMLTWLENDLAVNTADWVIVFWHHPPYTKGSHNSDSEGRLIDMRQNALPIIESWGVDLMMSGHSHSYERSFLLDGHYGLSGTLDPDTMILDIGDGRETGNGTYVKPNAAAVANAGAVYAVAGSSGKITSAALNHPAMFYSAAILGSLVIDVAGNRLDAQFIDDTGAVQDFFSIEKLPDSTPPMLLGAAATDASHVLVDFSENLDPATASDPANFTIAGLSVSNAALLTGNRSVELTTSAMTELQNYTLVVNNVEDTGSNVIAANSQTSFTYVNQVTIAFQDDVDPNSGYPGTDDAYIRQASPDTAHGTETTIQIDGDEPSGGGLDMHGLLRWDISAIPADAVVDSATIELNIVNISSGSYSCYELLRDWDQAQATWNRSDAATFWQSAGANGATDRDTVPLCTLNAGVTGIEQIALNNDGVDLVQAWVDGSTANYGLLIGNSATTDGADFTASEGATAANRPRLEIVYSLPPPVDSEAPTVPAGLVQTAVGETTAAFSWAASTDNVGVTGYNVYRDNVFTGSTAATSFADSGLSEDTGYSYEVSATDAAGNESARSSVLLITTDSSGPGFEDFTATAETPAAGSVSGSFADTQADDSNTQSITERESGGRKPNRHSYLEHRWTFNIVAGSMASLHVNAWSSGSSDGDTFNFAVSSDGVNYSSLINVSSLDDTNAQSAAIAGTPSGTIYVRVQDSDQGTGNRAKDTVFVDHLFIRVSDPPTDPPIGDPSELSATAASSSQINLSWIDGTSNETGFKIERSLDGSSWAEIDDIGPDSTSYSDSGLAANTPYYYQVRAYNPNGFSNYTGDSATTLPAQALSLEAAGYKVKGKHFVDLSWTAGGAVDIYRSPAGATTPLDTGVTQTTYTDDIGGKGGATYQHQVCEAGSTTVCSNITTTLF
jgi:chitodextrinase